MATFRGTSGGAYHAGFQPGQSGTGGRIPESGNSGDRTSRRRAQGRTAPARRTEKGRFPRSRQGGGIFVSARQYEDRRIGAGSVRNAGRLGPQTIRRRHPAGLEAGAVRRSAEGGRGARPDPFGQRDRRIPFRFLAQRSGLGRDPLSRLLRSSVAGGGRGKALHGTRRKYDDGGKPGFFRLRPARIRSRAAADEPHLRLCGANRLPPRNRHRAAPFARRSSGDPLRMHAADLALLPAFGVCGLHPDPFLRQSGPRALSVLRPRSGIGGVHARRHPGGFPQFHVQSLRHELLFRASVLLRGHKSGRLQRGQRAVAPDSGRIRKTRNLRPEAPDQSRRKHAARFSGQGAQADPERPQQHRLRRGAVHPQSDARGGIFGGGSPHGGHQGLLRIRCPGKGGGDLSLRPRVAGHCG